MFEETDSEGKRGEEYMGSYGARGVQLVHLLILRGFWSRWSFLDDCEKIQVKVEICRICLES